MSLQIVKISVRRSRSCVSVIEIAKAELCRLLTFHQYGARLYSWNCGNVESDGNFES